MSQYKHVFLKSKLDIDEFVTSIKQIDGVREVRKSDAQIDVWLQNEGLTIQLENLDEDDFFEEDEAFLNRLKGQGLIFPFEELHFRFYHSDALAQLVERIVECVAKQVDFVELKMGVFE